MNSVVHFEIPVDDVMRAEKFYKDAFAWEIFSVPEYKYALVTTTPVDEQKMPKKRGAINGGMLKRSEITPHPILVIEVKNVEELIHKVKDAGGKIIKDKLEIGDIGIAAYFKDTEGNVLCLWQSLKK